MKYKSKCFVQEYTQHIKGQSRCKSVVAVHVTYRNKMTLPQKMKQQTYANLCCCSIRQDVSRFSTQPAPFFIVALFHLISNSICCVRYITLIVTWLVTWFVLSESRHRT